MTTDLVAGGTMAGGAAFYASSTAAALGLRAAAWTSLGPDFPHRRDLGPVELELEPAAATTCFENRYEAGGRIQRVLSQASPLRAADRPAHLASVPVIYLCPVMGELELGLAKSFSTSLIGIGAQGWMRQAAPNGQVRPKRWRPTAAELAPVHFAVLSDEDAAGDVEIVERLIEQVPVVAFTHGAKGCELFVQGQRHEVPAYRTEQIGPTGAGDVFGAAMLAGLHWGFEPLQAAYLASCAAAIAVEAAGGGALDRLTESWDRLTAYGRTHGVTVPSRPDPN